MAIAVDEIVGTGAGDLLVSGGTSGNFDSITVDAGDLLICLIASITDTTFTVSDDKGNTWTLGPNQLSGGSNSRVQIWYAQNVAAGATVITVAAGAAATYRARAIEASGADTSSPLQTSSSIAEAGNPTAHVCSADATVIDATGEVLVVTISGSNAGNSYGTKTVGSGYTTVGFSGAGVFAQYQVFGSGVTNEQGAWTSGTGRSGAGAIAAFSVAGAAADPVELRGTYMVSGALSA